MCRLSISNPRYTPRTTPAAALVLGSWHLWYWLAPLLPSRSHFEKRHSDSDDTRINALSRFPHCFAVYNAPSRYFSIRPFFAFKARLLLRRVQALDATGSSLPRRPWHSEPECLRTRGGAGGTSVGMKPPKFLVRILLRKEDLSEISFPS